MKELSDYIESIFDGFLPRSVVNVKFDKGSYIIKVDLYDVTNLSKPEKEKTLKNPLQFLFLGSGQIGNHAPNQLDCFGVSHYKYIRPGQE